MGQLVYILGRSGTGKSYSMHNFPPDKIALINIQGKILPFRGSAKIKTVNTDQSSEIVKELDKLSKTYKSIVVDDYQYTMANEFMRRSTERGYDKFTEIGRHAWDIANKVGELPPDVIVYVMCHTDRDDEGNEKIKTIGKLLDEKICLEGMATIVLKTNVTDGQYSFLTQNNGKDTVKSPAGMFPSYAIDNDLYYVDQKIRNYYGIGDCLTDEDMKEIDETVKKDNVPFTGGEEKPSRRRRSAKKEESEKTPVKEEKEEVNENSGAASTDCAADAEDKPARKRRKNRNADVEEPQAEEPAAEEQPSVEPPAQEEKPSRRRRRRRSEAEDEPLPFE